MNESRLNQIDAALTAMKQAWPAVSAEIKVLIADDTERLIAKDSEETRGRIKALRDVMNLPEALEAERQSITAAELPDNGLGI